MRRLALTKTALIGFIDLMLLAGPVPGLHQRAARAAPLAAQERLRGQREPRAQDPARPHPPLRRDAGAAGGCPNEEKAQQYYRVINKESQRLTQLINNILDFSRIEAGRKEYRFVPTDVGAVVQRGGRGLPLPDRAAGLRARASTSPTTSRRSWSTPRRCRQALHQPAQQRDQVQPATRSTSASTCAARATGSLISVTDRGIGIPKAEQKRIFEKFYRVENSLVHTTKGSGLGLALVQHIMEAHGGQRRGRERARRRAAPSRSCSRCRRRRRAAGSARPPRPGYRRSIARAWKSSHEQDPDRGRRAGHGARAQGQLRVRGLRGGDRHRRRVGPRAGAGARSRT